MSNNRKKSFIYREIDDYKPQGDPAILAKSITELGLHSDTVAKLVSANINTLSDLASIEMRYAYRIENMNRKDVFAALRVLHSNKLDFKVNPNAKARSEEDSSSTETEGDTQSAIKRDNRNNQPRDNHNNRGQDRRPDKSTAQAGATTSVNPRQNNPDQATNRGSADDSRRERDRNRGRERGIAPQPAVAGQPPREKINTHDFLRGKISGESRDGGREGRRDRPNGRDGKFNNRDNDKNNRNGNKDAHMPAKRVIELPPLVIADGLYKFFQQGKWGFKDTSGKVIIEPQYDEAYNFSDGMAGVELGDKLGFINTQGEVVIDYQFESVCSFSEGLASVTRDEKSAYINKQGEYEWEYEFESATAFHEGISLVKKDGKWGYLSRETREIRLR